MGEVGLEKLGTVRVFLKMVTAMISICALSVDNNSIKCQGATQAPKFAQGWGGTSFSLLLHKKNGSALAVPPPPVITQEKFS